MRTCLLAATVIALTAATASAETVSDIAGDFAPGYTGAATDLDVRSFSVGYDVSSQIFSIGATMNGAINPATVGTYVIGINTGTGTSAPFASIGAPNVRFNQTFRINKDGTTTLGAAYVATIIGSSFTLNIPQSLFASTGFTPDRYGFNFWPRDGVGPGTFVTDFAPNNATITGAVPEPGTWTLMILGLGTVGWILRGRRRPVSRQPVLAG